MNSPFLLFSSACLISAAFIGWFFRGALSSLRGIASDHAKTYAVAYVKGGCLVLIAMGSAFKETFQPLTIEQANRMEWWDWAIAFFSPLLAGLAVLAAFLDRSTQRASEDKASEDKAKALTAPPFQVQPPVQ